MHYRLVMIAALVIGGAWVCAQPTRAADVRTMVFPILGGGGYRDDFGDPRSGGRTHQGNDIFAPKHTPLVATVSGRVRFIGWPQPSYGYIISIEDDDGYEYWYLHVNNDRPGTDDGQGGGNYAYAPGVDEGENVVAGQIIGYVGDSGNAESTPAHLHFEIHRPDGKTINPFLSLRAANIITRPVPTPLKENEWLPFANFRGGAFLAMGDTHPTAAGDEFVIGAGPGGGPLVRIFDTYRNPLGGFYAYDERYFRQGTDVAVGDINGDGTNEIITAPARGAEPFVRMFTARGELLAEFLAYPKSFIGGVNVAAADLDGDGIDEVITGSGPGQPPRLRIFRGTGELVAEWDAYVSLFRGGLDVAAVSATVDDAGYIVTGPLRGGGPDIRAWRADGSLLSSFFSYDRLFRGGTRVSASRNSVDELEIAIVPASGGGGNLRLHRLDGALVTGGLLFEQWWSGGYDVVTDGVTTTIVTAKSIRSTASRFQIRNNNSVNGGVNGE